MEILFFALVVSLSFGVLGFAQNRGEQIVKVALKQSVSIWGVRYHPNSAGVNMPRSHAQALGAEIIEDDHVAAAKVETDTVEELASKEDPGDVDDQSEDTSEASSPVEDFASKASGDTEVDEDVSEGGQVDLEANSDSETTNGNEDATVVLFELPEDFPSRDFLIKNGIDSIQKILAVPDLTDYKGIGEKTAEAIIAQAKQIESTW